MFSFDQIYKWMWDVGAWQKFIETAQVLSGGAAAWAAWEANKARKQTQEAMRQQAADGKVMVESASASSKAAQDTAKLARQEIQLGQLPWLIIKSFRPFTQNFGVMPHQYYVLIRNGGIGPALDCTMTYHTLLLPRVREFDEIIASSTHSIGVLTPNTDLEVLVQHDFPRNKQDSFNKDGAVLQVAGNVMYKDIFGKQRFLQFRYEWSPATQIFAALPGGILYSNEPVEL